MPIIDALSQKGTQNNVLIIIIRNDTECSKFNGYACNTIGNGHIEGAFMAFAIFDFKVGIKLHEFLALVACLLNDSIDYLNLASKFKGNVITRSW